MYLEIYKMKKSYSYLQANSNNSKYSIYRFIINVIKPFKLFITGQIMVGLIWAIDMSLRPYLIKVILNLESR